MIAQAEARLIIIRHPAAGNQAQNYQDKRIPKVCRLANRRNSVANL
jgi:hypothetical protein